MVSALNYFSTFYIGYDTIAPVIKPLLIDSKNTIQDSIALRFKITDNLSGICCYQGKINGSWRLFEYDAKNNMLEYLFDENTPKGKLETELIVWDKKENKQTFKAQLYRP